MMVLFKSIKLLFVCVPATGRADQAQREGDKEKG